MFRNRLLDDLVSPSDTKSKTGRIGFVCCVKEGYDSLKNLLDMKFRCDFIITFDDRIAAKYSGAAKYDRLAEEAGIDLYKISSINSIDAALLLKRLSPAVLFIIGWSEIIRREILEIPSIGVIGFHASLLPEYRGPAPVNWALINGEKKTGNTMFWMSPGIDTGDIIDQRVISISEKDTCASVYSKVSRSEVSMIMDNIDKILSGEITAKKQTTVLPRMKKRFPEDGVIRWDTKSHNIYNLVRALTQPYPGAFTFFNKKKLYIWDASPEHDSSLLPAGNYEPGTVLNINQKGISIACGHGIITLKKLQIEEDDILNGQQFAERYHIKEGRRLHDRPQRVAVFVSHYDDEVLGIGGTLIEHFKKGDEIFVYIVCESGSVRYSDQDVPLHSYALDASYYIGAKNLTCFGYPDQKLDTIPLIDVTQKIETELNKIRPDIVYTHFAGDINEDHRIVNKATITACRVNNADYVKMLAVFETPSSTEWGDFQEGESSFHPNCFIDISSSMERKLYAMKCYKSEVKTYNHPRSISALRNRAKYWGSVCNRSFAEPLLIIKMFDPFKC